ncbi:MAG TPA: 50S ribosome-binding GTPase [Syntrophales bacterium]|nr:50S ribosome-binding GTPase [Syntrophales bacterium]HPQ43796.1 50S ribosome-binding GTPase [Syntrophales bacterium]
MAILVDRDHIGIFGKMNSGKSSIMNLLTQQETSIVDPTPGTTADTKIALQEIHGMGPVKLFDTAGADEGSILGDKKRKKIFADLKECDLVLLVIDPGSRIFDIENELLSQARDLDKQILVIYNLFKSEDEEMIDTIEQKLPLLRFYKKIILVATDIDFRQLLLQFILDNFESKNHKMPLLPFLEENEFYILIIPMDEETPPGRYLRPQAMVEEYITRHWAYPVSFRLNLGKARSNNDLEREGEKKRFHDLVNGLGKPPKAVITDSQAMDVMSLWCPDQVLLTTFSIVMINYISRGRLNLFVKGLKALDSFEEGDTVLIVEACNHSRIGEDIGTVQIPNYLKKRNPGVRIEHNFGREFQENEDLKKYKLVIHCGGCMITPQKLSARIRDLENIGVPFTNYGLTLSYMQGQAALNKVLIPWNLA